MKNPNDADFKLQPISPDKLAATTLEWLRKQSTEYLVATLASGVPSEGLEWDEHGKISEGNHRVQVLTERGYDVAALARKVWAAHGGGSR